METVSLSIIYLRTNKENATTTGQIYLNLSPNFQREYEAWDDKLRTRFIETIIIGRATNPIWIIFNEEENCEEILDGMHRIKTALSYFNNEFSINKNYLMSLNHEEYNKKKFKELSIDDQNKIRNYSFIMNKLDSSYRRDLNKLRDMYEILNRSSRTLNDYEFNKILQRPLYNIINEYKPLFVKVNLFSKLTDLRGNIESNLLDMIVLSYPLPNSWSSINNLKEDWVKKTLGETYEDVNNFVNLNKEILRNKFKLMEKIINDFTELKLFSTDQKQIKNLFVPYKFLVSRCCFLLKEYSNFNRISKNIVEHCLKELLVDSIEKKLGCSHRNASFQKNLIKKIDEIINYQFEQVGGNKRFFSKKEIQEKLLEQQRICPACKEKIEELDKYEGDHIISWTAGGKTISENLQILHKRCHQLK
jgi:hypothetical protein